MTDFEQRMRNLINASSLTKTSGGFTFASDELASTTPNATSTNAGAAKVEDVDAMMSGLLDSIAAVRQSRKKALDEVPPHLRDVVSDALGWSSPKPTPFLPINSMYGSMGSHNMGMMPIHTIGSIVKVTA